VHLAAIGHPILCDALYGREEAITPASLDATAPENPGLRRQALHAARLVIPHPATGAPTEFTAPLAADIAAFCDALAGHAGLPATLDR